VRYIVIFFAILVVFAACQKDPVTPQGDLSDIPYAPKPYVMPELPYFFPQMPIPADNPLTVDGVALGRFIFYDPILSADSTISCASCHRQELAFADDKAFSIGIRGQQTLRSAPSLANVGFYLKGLFWDGRVKTLEELSLHPVVDPLEMDNTFEKLIDDLRAHPQYPERFRKAFGIEDRQEISKELMAKALAQFMRTLVSYNAHYDYGNWDRGEETQFFTESQLRGKILFTTEPVDQTQAHPGCSHCHNNTALLTTNEFLNNGLDPALEPHQFPDPGLGAVTQRPIDYGRFKVPTLRNIELTAPYMHDGRFQTLEEVLDHYSSGGHYSYNLDANIMPFQLSAQDKLDLIAFLKSMTDEKFLQENAFKNPFE
jgi:cytochrome c peroxidase